MEYSGILQEQFNQPLMTKLPSISSSQGPTTLINRSGHFYQLHRPHLTLPPPSQPRPRKQRKTGTSADTDTSKVEAAVATAAAVNKKHQQQQAASQATNVHLSQHHCQNDTHINPAVTHHTIDGSSRHHHLNPQRTKPTRQQPTTSTHVSCLYPEILAMIFSNLDVKDRGRAAQVCVAWREAAYHRSGWRGVEARIHLKKHSSAVFSCLEKRGINRVQILSLTMRRGLTDVFRGLPNLQSLNLSGCYNMTDVGLNAALNHYFPSLIELNLSLCKNITDVSLSKISHCLKNLEILELGGCGNITNSGLHVISWGLKNLRRLDLRSCWHISDHGIGFLAGLNEEGDGTLKLEHLGLQDCQRLSDEGLRHVAQGLSSCLKSINLSFCVLITDSGMKHIAKVSSLRELDLRSCDNISEIGIAYLAEGGSRISSLDVSFCDKIGDQALQHISQGLFNLKSLSMAACPISDEGICKIAKTQQELETLHIGQCSRLTDKSVFTIIDSMPHIRCIDLYGCTKISKYALEKIEIKMPPISLNRDLWQERR